MRVCVCESINSARRSFSIILYEQRRRGEKTATTTTTIEMSKRRDTTVIKKQTHTLPSLVHCVRRSSRKKKRRNTHTYNTRVRYYKARRRKTYDDALNFIFFFSERRRRTLCTRPGLRIIIILIIMYSDNDNENERRKNDKKLSESNADLAEGCFSKRVHKRDLYDLVYHTDKWSQYIIDSVHPISSFARLKRLNSFFVDFLFRQLIHNNNVQYMREIGRFQPFSRTQYKSNTDRLTTYTPGKQTLVENRDAPNVRRWR